ncbi:hypothetical protein C5F50_10095 [Nitrosopumilus ureiphilus]|uniref:Uncharacterized protein n=2 Tax=Nitrosopumilus ureiphilus TaxID=1470067 RepID=A0A7D5R3V5_9ARCH|nr:hypothetical protein C5F50_10095 [Nitrosopumilus ureiphilus]
MSQIMQIAKEKTPSNVLILENGDVKNTPASSSVYIGSDMMGLSWMILDYPESYLDNNKRRC